MNINTFYNWRRQLHALVAVVLLALMASASAVLPEPSWYGRDGIYGAIYGSADAAKNSFIKDIEFYNTNRAPDGTYPYVCHLSDWSWTLSNVSVNQATWGATTTAIGRCIHNSNFPIMARCQDGAYAVIQVSGDSASCACPADRPVEVKNRCYPPCPEGQKRGEVSLQCRPDCPAGTYLTTSNTCKPLPPCPNPPCVPPDDADPDAGLPNPCSGNPINTATGNKFQTEWDLNWGPGLEFVRYYNGNGKTAPGMYKGWRHNFSQQIRAVYQQTYQKPTGDLNADWPIVNLNSAVIDHYVVDRPDGKSYNFSVTGVAIDKSPANRYSLTILADGFLLQDGDNKENYDAMGRLTRWEKIGQFVVTAQYDVANRLSRLNDSRGYQLVFGYDGSSLMASVSVMGAGIAANYKPDAYSRLAVVKYIGGTQYTRNYFYEDPNNLNLLTGIKDENDVRYATWTYDAQGRAIESKHAGDADKVTLSFGTDGANRYTDETDILGATRRFTFKQRGKSWDVIGNSQPGGSGCTAASSALGYDANGNINSRTNFNGVTTTYVFDLSRNLETSRTEAVGTPVQRTVTTEWHPTYRLPTKITEPGKITEYAYDSQAHVTLKTITDLTVSGGVQRSTSYTYVYNSDVNNPYVKKLTVDGPRTGIADVVVYDYDTKGNLVSMTQQTSASTSLVTTYGNYDAVGRVGTITDPNGRVTQLTYTPRGWLSTRVVGFNTSTPLKTSFTYDGVGQITKVTLPDNSFVAYTYDAAHRLTDIRDGVGNRIHYTLDLAGNRIKEEVTDSTGVLASLLSQIQLAQQDAQLPRVGEAL